MREVLVDFALQKMNDQYVKGLSIFIERGGKRGKAGGFKLAFYLY
jgi:hypothetical protein